jgi:hypothetical protein
MLGIANVHLVDLFRHVWCNTVKSLCCDGNGSPGELLSICLAQENPEVYPSAYPGKFNKLERDSRQCSSLNTRYTCEKDVLTLRLLKDKWLTGLGRL